MGGQTWGLIAHIALGNLLGARAQLKLLMNGAEILRIPQRISLANSAQAVLLYVEGQWEAIRELQLHLLSNNVSTNTISLIVQMLMEYQLGNVSQADTYLQEIMSTPSYLPTRATIVDAQWLLALAIASSITSTDNHLSGAREAQRAVRSPR